MEQTTYDVFISYSRKDYVDKEGKEIPGNVISFIKETLKKHGISYWMDEEGNLTAKKFASIIAGKIRESMDFLFVCSKNSVASRWVERELSVADISEKHIIPFICDDSYKDDKVIMYTAAVNRIEYYTNSEKALNKLVSVIEGDKKGLEQKLLKEEIKGLVDDYQVHSAQQEMIVQQLISKNVDLGLKSKRCPVCDNTVLLNKSYCDKCGWQFPSLYSLDGRKTPICNESQLALARTHWHGLRSVMRLQNENQKLKKDKEEIISEETNFTIRLSKAAKEFNVGKDTIVEFLTKKGFQVDSSPNTKLTGEMFALLVKEYQSEKELKNEAIRIAKERYNAEEKQRQEEAARKERVFFVGEVPFKMIYVEGGTFQMGAQRTNPSGRNYNIEAYDDEIPVHDVKVSSFYMCETVVTQALWKAVMGSEPARNGGWEDQCGKGDNYPAYCVSFNDIVNEFIPKLNQLTSKDFRLPTEAEWEYAARGGQKGNNGFKYSGSNDIEEVAWYWKNSGDEHLSGSWDSDKIEKNNCRTHPVKKKKSNELGLYDMSGNVWEWCKDWYEEKYYFHSPQNNPQGPLSGFLRVLRGGSWDDGPKDCRVSIREKSDPLIYANNGGFRLVLSR